MAGFKIMTNSVSQGLEQIGSVNRESIFSKSIDDKKIPAKDFMAYVKEGVNEVNQMQKTADKMSVDVASGNAENLHETMLALTQAELSFNLMVQVRNKGLEAYQEIMRMQV
jgi:flagellar hook-basal body complex protein FliE